MADHDYVPQSAIPAPGSALPSGRPNTPSRWSRLGRYRQLGVAAAAVLLVLALAWPLIEHPARELAVGTVYDTSYAVTTDHRASVTLPWGTLRVSTSDPRDSLPHDVARYDAGGSVQPPDGGRFVGVRWRASTAFDTTSFRLATAAGHRTHVALLTGGSTLPLDPGSEHVACAAQTVCVGPYGNNKAWVAVPGPASDLRVAVRYDGVTQTVDMKTGRVHRGRAAALYATPSSPPAIGSSVLDAPSCGSPTWSAGFTGAKASCTASVTRTAYVGGAGWAGSGHVWVAAVIDTDRPYSVTYHRGGTQKFFAESFVNTVTYSIDGGRLAADQAVGTTAGDLGVGRTLYPGHIVVFSVPASDHHPITVRSTWGLEARDLSRPASPGTTYATATWTVHQ